MPFSGFFMSYDARDKVVVSINGDSLNSMKKGIDKAVSKGAKAIETRCDGMYEFESPGMSFPPLKGIMQYSANLTHVLTFRSVAQAGGFGGFRLPRAYSDSAPQVEQHRRAYIAQAVKFAREMGKHFIIDFEEQNKGEISNVVLPVRTLVSYHDNEKTPRFVEISQIYKRLTETNANIIKLVTRANSYEDGLAILMLIQQHQEAKNGKGLIAFCTGAHGAVTRVLSPLFGADYTFACLGNEKTAPGQLSFEETTRAMMEAHDLIRRRDIKSPRELDAESLEKIAEQIRVHNSHIA